jgi:hypothetical protein
MRWSLKIAKLAQIGLFYNPLLLLIAFFVWMGAAQETRMIRAKSALDRVP